MSSDEQRPTEGRHSHRHLSRRRRERDAVPAADAAAVGAPAAAAESLHGPDVVAPAAARTGRRGVRRGVRIGAQVVAAITSAAVVVGSGFAWHEYRAFNNGVSVGAAVPEATGSLGPGATPAPHSDQNILLLGNDSRAGATPEELVALGASEDGGSYNTDTMLILHVPADGSQATAISFPRDSYVDIPGYNGKDKLNAAYPDGYQTAQQQGADERASESAGIQVLINTLSELTGVHIDHYVQINLLGFYRISIALQGVQVCLVAGAHEPRSGIDLGPGVQTIEGKQALAFVRQRYDFPDGNGDLDRIHRQQYFLSAVFRKVLSAGTLLNPSKLSKLLGAVSSSLLVDPDLNFFDLASQLSDLQAGNLNFYTIPTAGFLDGTPSGSVVKIDPAAVQAFVQNTFDPPAPVTGSSSSAAPTGSTSAAPTPVTSTPADDGGVNTNPAPVNAADAGCIT